MSRTITALFDSRTDAEAARTRLTSSRIDATRVRVIDQSTAGSSTGGTATGGTGDGQGEGFWASLKDLFIPDEDRAVYSEGVRRGGYLVVAEVDEDQADEACRILDEANGLDLDQRESQWRSEGWAGSTAGAGAGTFGSTAATGMTGTAGTTGNRGAFFGGTTGTTNDRGIEEERIPIVEEELRVGKREVNRGTARVRSYIREVPVHEQVTLREEHVDIERRPVDQTLRSGELGDAFREREIEVTETAEEAVVAKEARIREELVVRKTAEERVEQIDDTVRRTEVDVDQDGRRGDYATSGTERSDYGTTGTSGTTRRDRDDLI